jgi:hypothetical protein|tara:strand:- start:2805 stop:3530 length:726 start_codon:yes stop_codon:yes gene_type:complete
MSTTYLILTNDLLRRINEVELTSANFSAAKNVQAIAKDAINNSIREILQDGHQFPFLKTAQSQTLTSGTGRYDFPTDMASVDWDTFYISQLASSLNTAKSLPVVSFEEYTKQYRALDDSSGTGGYSAPSLVYQTAEEKFGVTPIPDASYIIDYVYYKFPNDLSLQSDTTLIPDRFRYIVVDGAMSYMMRFRSNEQSAQIHDAKFRNGIKVMRRLLLDDIINVRSTVISRSKFSSNLVSLTT